MEDSFKARVDKVFGSLLGSLPSKSPSPWTLTDAEIERKEWIREKGGSSSPDREDVPCSSAFDGFFSNEKKRNSNFLRNSKKRFEDDLDDFDNDDEEGDDSTAQDGRDYEREDWEIRNSVGLDSTLDHEDEEDEYDKVAVGRENVGERVYMRDVTDYGPYLSSHNIFPDSFEEIKSAGKDPHADHLAAKARLQEDNNEAAGRFDSLQASDSEMPVIVESQVKAAEDYRNVKSILKRKDNQIDSRSKKRVRFDTGCKDELDSEQAHDFLMVTQSMEAATVAEASGPPPEDAPGVPDYIRNPSKYTRYSFDTSSEDDDASNLHAFQDLQNMVKASSTHAELLPELDCTTTSLPKSVLFTPRKKAGDATGMSNRSEAKQIHEDDACKEPVRQAAYLADIAAGDGQDDEACAMEEDDVKTSKLEVSSGLRKVDRQYRSKVSSDDSTC
ncbi:uncharacterized protein LOC131239309 [Magnolia sinica]|uniref:uncharacterized protein LOC131239309 n=1 Tax=Magnolia sinica TaxID=86752 RepID=UPI0026591E65|nr:uncharacterized protein LOC131239309 [Magnolia sinica]